MTDRRLLSDDMFVRLCRSREYIGDYANTSVSLDRAARVACLSKFHYLRMFATAFGETPGEFSTRLRMERARALLLANNHTVTEVCMEIGYDSVATFSNRFRRFAGASPSELQRRARTSLAMPSMAAIYNVPSCFFLSNL